MLEEVIKKVVRQLEEGKIDERVESYENLKNNWVAMVPRVTVRVQTKSGLIAEIDVSDYFGEV